MSMFLIHSLMPSNFKLGDSLEGSEDKVVSHLVIN
jgi:hypothetical protein